MPRVFTERSEVPLVTLNLCVMRWHNLGEGDLVSTHSIHYSNNTMIITENRVYQVLLL